jgi:hypothetical protein
MMRYLFLSILLFFILISNPLQAQWTPIAIDPTASIFSLYILDNTIYAGGDSILYHSDNGGQVWNRSSKVGNVEYGITSIKKWNNTIFVGTAGRGIFSSTDNGLNWTPLNNGLNNIGALEISSLAIRGDSLYAGTVGEGVFVLNLLNSVQWNNFRDGLPFGVAWNVYSLYNFNGSLISGAGGNAKVYINEPGSSVWIEKGFDFSAPEPNAMIALNNFGDTLIGVSYFGIYRSINQGESWEYFNPGIGLINFGNITIANSVIFAIISKLGRSYLLSSINSGSSWQFEFEFIDISYTVEYFNGKLYTGRGNGLYSLPYNPTTSDPDIASPDKYELFQNYPNPFNPETVIIWYMPEPGDVSLKVYDVLGNEIFTLINEFQSAGMHKITFNANELSSGIYFYKLVTDSFIQARKMSVIK